MLEVVSLECTRGDRALISDLSFALGAGELLYVVGSNGSGKTTLLRTLCGLSTPSAGEIRWNGKNIRTLGDEYRVHINYVGHNDGIQGELTPEENLRVAACVRGSPEPASARRVLERVGLLGFAHLPTKVLSQGQKRRLALGRLLISRNSLWVLDEPVSGLDVRSVEVIEDLLSEHLASSGMIIITSHQALNWRSAAVHRISLDP